MYSIGRRSRAQRPQPLQRCYERRNLVIDAFIDLGANVTTCVRPSLGAWQHPAPELPDMAAFPSTRMIHRSRPATNIWWRPLQCLTTAYSQRKTARPRCQRTPPGPAARVPLRFAGGSSVTFRRRSGVGASPGERQLRGCEAGDRPVDDAGTRIERRVAFGEQRDADTGCDGFEDLVRGTGFCGDERLGTVSGVARARSRGADRRRVAAR
jgi:hypothetical protein